MSLSAVLAHGDWSGLIYLTVLYVAAIIAGCFLVIAGSFWITAKLGGSKELVWGAILGVATAHCLSFGIGYSVLYEFHMLERILPHVATGAAIACFVNLIIWFRKGRLSQSNAMPSPVNPEE